LFCYNLFPTICIPIVGLKQIKLIKNKKTTSFLENIRLRLSIILGTLRPNKYSGEEISFPGA
jgi:hypothetical protein